MPRETRSDWMFEKRKDPGRRVVVLLIGTRMFGLSSLQAPGDFSWPPPRTAQPLRPRSLDPGVSP